jgi:isoamylase
MLASLFLSQGIPMLLAGDEFGQTQHGNNNAYCQDNETAWLNWDAAQEDLIDAVANLSAFRRANVALRQRRFATAPDDGNPDTPVVRWYHCSGREMHDEDWGDEGLDCLGMELAAASGEPPVLVILNAGDDAEFSLPEGNWLCCIDTSNDDISRGDEVTGVLKIGWQSVVALVRQPGD